MELDHHIPRVTNAPEVCDETACRGSVSVIIASYRSWDTLPLVLDALAPQVEAEGCDVVVVDSSADGRAEQVAKRWPWLRLIALPERAPPGRARNLGVEVCLGEIVAFVDADAIPEPNWLAALRSDLTAEVDAVAGAVLNGTPRSRVGTAGYLLEFADWMPERHGRVEHGATCNLLVRRDVLLRAGGFREDIEGGEDTIFTFTLGRAGRLAFAPAARVRHLNRTAWRSYLRHQRALGRSFVIVCGSVDFPHGWLARPSLSPAAFLFRLAALGRRLLPHPGRLARAVALTPHLVAGTFAWALGVATPPGRQASHRGPPQF
jgi:GT2 family glycosyltransferase